MQKREKYSYLALGDSYTIGEAVSIADSFPYQAIQFLRKAGYDFYAAEIIAKTGWTTDEMLQAIQQTRFSSQYDFVSLLAGVNNQYRKMSIDDYAVSFEALLQQAIAFADNSSSHVFVLSIPDWGVTPFAKDNNPDIVSKEIDRFNAINERLAIQYHTGYINITGESRKALSDESLLTHDKLHPSGKAYSIWANELVKKIKAAITLS